mmetsp:Transcript_1890/g.7035  ORF Transcript_1890/g.7035 Transcript_1890/m.7035 type:complete len:299 (+) Transcript_1890:1074-1970(+)
MCPTRRRLRVPRLRLSPTPTLTPPYPSHTPSTPHHSYHVPVAPILRQASQDRTRFSFPTRARRKIQNSLVASDNIWARQIVRASPAQTNISTSDTTSAQCPLARTRAFSTRRASQRDRACESSLQRAPRAEARAGALRRRVSASMRTRRVYSPTRAPETHPSAHSARAAPHHSMVRRSPLSPPPHAYARMIRSTRARPRPRRPTVLYTKTYTHARVRASPTPVTPPQFQSIKTPHRRPTRARRWRRQTSRSTRALGAPRTTRRRRSPQTPRILETPRAMTLARRVPTRTHPVATRARR